MKQWLGGDDEEKELIDIKFTTIKAVPENNEML